MSEQPQHENDQQAPQDDQPDAAPAAVGDVVHFDVENPYAEEGARVDTHAGLVVAAEDGRVRVFDLGAIEQGTADFPADAVRSAG